MQIRSTEMELKRYQLCGHLLPIPTPLHFVGNRGAGLFDVKVPDNLNLQGRVTYVHVMDGEFMKCGQIKPNQKLRNRMRSSYGCLRKPIDLLNRGLLRYVDETLYWTDPAFGNGRSDYDEDFPWKHRVPPAMLKGRSVDLWARLHDSKELMDSEEDTPNTFYRGEWAEEGWSSFRSPDGRPVRHRILPGSDAGSEPG